MTKLQQRKISAIVSKLLEWYPQNARDLPWRQTSDPYCVFVSEIMLQQTQVKTMLPYWERWMQVVPGVEALAEASLAKLHKLWEGLGYYHRVHNMQRAARMVLELHGGDFPQSDPELQNLPGIGRYTAGAIRSIAFDQPAPIVDGNVMRVLTRVWAIGGDPRAAQVNERLWQLAQGLVSQADALRLNKSPRLNLLNRPCSSLNQALMELGALVCVPRKPLCAGCPLAICCVAFQQGRVDRLPELPQRSPPTRRRMQAFLAEHNGGFLVRQRPPKGINAQLWEFPNVEVKDQARPLAGAFRALGARPRKVERWLTIKHSITRYRITLEVFRAAGFPGAKPKGHWLTPAQLAQLPLTSAHKKILLRLPPAQ